MYGDADFGLWYVNDYYRLKTYAKSGICQTGTSNLIMEYSIYPNQNWIYTTEVEEQLVIGSPSYQDWNGQTAFAGVKFTIARTISLWLDTI